MSESESSELTWVTDRERRLEAQLAAVTAERDAAVAKLQALAEWLQAEQTVHSPWPTEVWPSTLSDCVEAIPNERDRGAISSTLMREGWQHAVQDLRDALAASEAESTAERISKAYKQASEVAAQLAEARRVDPADLRIPFMASGGESEEAES